jgi:hypothetical protein
MVDQSLHRAEEVGAEVPVAADTAQDAPPGAPGVLRPTQRAADAGLPVLAVWYSRPPLDTDRRGFDRFPDIDVRMTDHQDVLVRDLGRDAGFLGVGDQVVHQHAQPGRRGGGEGVDDRRLERDPAQIWLREKIVAAMDFDTAYAPVNLATPESRFGNPELPGRA